MRLDRVDDEQQLGVAAGFVAGTALAAAGGLSEVIHHEIVAGRAARLVTLAPDMVETVLSPIWAEAGWQ